MGELETTVRDLMSAFDRKEFGVVRGMLAPDGQGIDEISRRWLRDADEIGAYFDQLEGSVDEISSTLTDLQERVWGDVGVVTCWLDQDYTLDGQPQHTSAPTTIILRRTDDAWRVALIHTVPLPDES